jgi:hypothetical protein
MERMSIGSALRVRIRALEAFARRGRFRWDLIRGIGGRVGIMRSFTHAQEEISHALAT